MGTLLCPHETVFEMHQSDCIPSATVLTFFESLQAFDQNRVQSLIKNDVDAKLLNWAILEVDVAMSSGCGVRLVRPGVKSNTVFMTSPALSRFVNRVNFNVFS